MIKLFLATLLIFFNIQARENPFFPSEGEKDIPYTSNIDKSTPQLKRAAISLPSHARVIKKVTIEYENLDASLESKSIELENSVDWHLPIFISQSYIDESAKTQSKENGVKISEAKEDSVYKSVAEIKYAKFLTLNKTMKIVTKDELLRDFLLVQPHRIVIDFKRDSSMKSYDKNLKDSVFTKVRIGNHDGYYRVVIELDGYYRYNLKKLSDGCIITLE